MNAEKAEGGTEAPPGVYFEGAIWGAAVALFGVGLIEGWGVAAASGLGGIMFQFARAARWVMRVSPADE